MISVSSFWLTSLSMTVSRSIHVSTITQFYFFIWLSNIPLYTIGMLDQFSLPQFLSCFSKELKWQTRITQAGKVYWASSKQYTLKLSILTFRECTNPAEVILPHFWLPFFNPLFLPGGSPEPDWFCPMQIGHIPETNLGSGHVGHAFLLQVFTPVHNFPLLSVFFLSLFTIHVVLLVVSSSDCHFGPFFPTLTAKHFYLLFAMLLDSWIVE